jgi:ribosomal protein S18 acetylase RimI-like enzyme
MNEVEIIQVIPDYNIIINISSLHRQLFDKEHFTARFNEKLLNKYFEELLSHSSYNLFAFNGKEFVGYLIAGEKLDNVLKKFSKDYFFQLIILLIKNPKFLIEKLIDFFESIFNKNKKSKAEMRLFLIASKHNENLKGVGSSLIKNLEKKLIQNGKFIYGLSVRKHNQNAIDFYLRLGFVEEFRTHKSIYLIKNLQEK